MKTSELTGAALDWAVAAALEVQFKEYRVVKVCRHEPTTPAWIERENAMGVFIYQRFCPSTDWEQGGPIIERVGISVIHDEYAEEHWCAQTDQDVYGDGPTPLIAAMRCYVASKLGDEVELPTGL
jgi:hypothetical protein